MSQKHPVVAVTGSSGAGTSTVKKAFEHIFRRETITPVIVEGDSFHAFDRAAMKVEMEKHEAAGNRFFSHFGENANEFGKLAELFESYSKKGSGKKRYYLHSEPEAVEHNARLGVDKKPGEFTPWEDIESGSDLMFYEGLHGLVKTENHDIAQHVDLGIGVVPIVNLEWIQKIHRDRDQRGYSTEAITDVILRRMDAYVNCITPQFSETDINFQRVPVVDTSNPFIARSIPTPDESLVVIRFKDPHGIDFRYLTAMIEGSWMSRANSIVVPGGKMDLAMQLILTPLILRLADNAKRA